MKSVGSFKKFAQRLIYQAACLLLVVAIIFVIGFSFAGAADDRGESEPAWANPTAMSLKRIGAIDGAQHQPNFLSNLDCNLMTYRLVGDSTMRSGCFTPTAFGLMDSGSDTIIFNGTDEGLPLLPYWPSHVLAPWPGAPGLLVLDAVSTGGSYLSLYRSPLSQLQDRRNVLGQLTAKQLTAGPELPLKDRSGQRLVINPQTMAFSDGGSWLVVETLGGSFVRINLATLDITAFAPAFGSQGSPGLLQSQVAVSGDGRYVAIGNKDAASLKVYDLSACSGVINNLRPLNCAAHDYFSFAQQRISSLQAARHLRFVNDGLLSFEAQTGDPASAAVYELAPLGSITSLTDYIGLGDSYTSGEGAFDYLAGTDTDDNMCHLSVHSYPLLLTRDLFGVAGGHSVACSGAVINDVSSTSDSYRGQARQAQAALLNSIMAGYSAGYVAQHRFVRQYQPIVTTVSVGGNDIGFGDILQKCVVPHLGLRPGANSCYNTYEDRLEVIRLVDRTVPRWTALYKQLRAEAPGTQLYAIGYPQIADNKGNCALNVHLDHSELEFSKELIDYLNGAIRRAAEAGGATYVDISQALAGHRLCEVASFDVAVNGLTAGTDAGALGVKVFGKESYHPNALGQSLIEQAILEQTHNLTATKPASPVNTDSQAILQAPKSGRATNVIVPDDSLTTGLLHIGLGTPLHASGTRDGLKSNTAYTIRLDGSGGPIIATGLSSAGGDISTSIVLPGYTVPGGHTIDLTGQNQAGEPVDVTQPVYVAFSDNDADSDGIPDSLDTCPGAAASGQDGDQDGVDDSCDTLIGRPPVAGSQDSSGDSVVVGLAETNNKTAKANIGRVQGTGASLEVPVRFQTKALRRPLAKLYTVSWLPWVALTVAVCISILLSRHISMYKAGRFRLQ